jgi:hypothetical protein
MSSPVIAATKANVSPEEQIDTLGTRFQVEPAIEMPKISMEEILRELRFIRVLVNRDRAGYFAVRTDLFEKLYEAAQEKEEKSYVDWALNTATIVSMALNILTIVAVTSPKAIESTGNFFLGNNNPFVHTRVQLPKINALDPDEVLRFTADYTKMTRAATKVFTSGTRIVDSGKQWRETSNQGERLQASNVKDRNKLRFDRCEKEDSTSRQEVVSGFRDDEDMIRKRAELVQVLTRA